MDNRLIKAVLVCGLLLSFAVPAFAHPDAASDIAVPDTASFTWLVSSAAASLIGLRLYLSKKK